MAATQRCPCGSGAEYAACCGPFHAGDATAPTAEALMRSRFSAFALSKPDYLRDTWHATTRPAEVGLDRRLRWTRLNIVDTEAGGPADLTGVVEFRAHYRAGKQRGVLHERSSFVRLDGRWLYLSG
jgi:SEC-C motif-containing protein